MIFLSLLWLCCGNKPLTPRDSLNLYGCSQRDLIMSQLTVSQKCFTNAQNKLSIITILKPSCTRLRSQTGSLASFFHFCPWSQTSYRSWSGVDSAIISHFSGEVLCRRRGRSNWWQDVSHGTFVCWWLRNTRAYVYCNALINTLRWCWTWFDPLLIYFVGYQACHSPMISLSWPVHASFNLSCVVDVGSEFIHFSYILAIYIANVLSFHMLPAGDCHSLSNLVGTHWLNLN